MIDNFRLRRAQGRFTEDPTLMLERYHAILIGLIRERLAPKAGWRQRWNLCADRAGRAPRRHPAIGSISTWCSTCWKFAPTFKPWRRVRRSRQASPIRPSTAWRPSGSVWTREPAWRWKTVPAVCARKGRGHALHRGAGRRATGRGRCWLRGPRRRRQRARWAAGGGIPMPALRERIQLLLPPARGWPPFL